MTECWIFEGDGTIGRYVGGYFDAQQQRAQVQSLKAPAEKTAKPEATEEKRKDNIKKANTSAKLSYKLQRELEQLPSLLESLDEEIQQLQSQVSAPEFFNQPHDETDKVLKLLAEKEHALEEAFERWQTLEAMQSGN